MIDLAVVGGGLAGTYLAYRLQQLRPSWPITLFESSSRIGGRLLSVRAPRIADVPAELGGMRYRSSQPLIRSVINELELETRPFPVTHDDNRYYLRNSHLRAQELTDPSQVPYNLQAPYEGLSPAELIVSAFETVVPEASDLSGKQWADVRRNHRFNGRALNDWGLGDLLRTVVGDEGYDFLVGGLGYSSIFGNWNAAEAIPWFLIETRPDSENRTLVDGMERLPRELARQLEEHNGTILLRHRLVRVEPTHEDGRGCELLFSDGQRLNAQRVVFALPLAPLQAIVDQSNFLQTPQMSALLSSVTAHPMTKVFLTYERGWWREAGFKGRRTISDLALRKTYFFDWPGSDTGEPSLLLASYGDGQSVDYWRRFFHPRSAPDDAASFDSEQRWDLYAAPDELMTDAHHQVIQAHGVTDVGAPLAGAVMDWGVEPFEGAWHAWKPGVKSWEVLAHLVQPVQHQSIFVCGEAISSWQGWMEGALETAEVVVNRLGHN